MNGDDEETTVYLELLVFLRVDLLIELNVQVEVERRRQTEKIDLKILVAEDSFTEDEESPLVSRLSSLVSPPLSRVYFSPKI